MKLLTGVLFALLAFVGVAAGQSQLPGVYEASPATLVDLQRTPLLTDVNRRLQIGALLPGTGATNLGKAEDSGHTTADVGVMMLGVRQDTASALAASNTEYMPMIFDASGRQWITGQIAHDSGISGAPVRTGGRALTANYTAVATGDAADFVTTTVGAQIIKTNSIPELDWSFASAASGIVNTTTAVTIKTAAGAGIRNYITGCQVQTATLGGATELAIRDGAGGTVIFRTQLQTTALPLLSINFDSPLKGTANTLLEVVTLTGVTGGVYVNCQGYSAP